MKRAQTYITLALVLLLAFTATAIAGQQALPEDGSWLDLLSPIYQAFAGGNYWYAGALTLSVGVALLIKYAPDSIRKYTDHTAGKALLVLVASFVTTMAAHLADGSSPNFDMVKTAAHLAAVAAGGFSLIKPFVEMLLASEWYKTKVPSWMQKAIGALFFMFTRKADSVAVIKAAEASADAKVKAEPGPGASKVTGKFDEF